MHQPKRQGLSRCLPPQVHGGQVPPHPSTAHPPPTNTSGANIPLWIPLGSSFQACAFIFQPCKPVHFLQLIVSAFLYLNTANALVGILEKNPKRAGLAKGCRTLQLRALCAKLCATFPCSPKSGLLENEKVEKKGKIRSSRSFLVPPSPCGAGGATEDAANPSTLMGCLIYGKLAWAELFGSVFWKSIEVCLCHAKAKLPRRSCFRGEKLKRMQPGGLFFTLVLGMYLFSLTVTYSLAFFPILLGQ